MPDQKNNKRKKFPSPENTYSSMAKKIRVRPQGDYERALKRRLKGDQPYASSVDSTSMSDEEISKAIEMGKKADEIKLGLKDKERKFAPQKTGPYEAIQREHAGLMRKMSSGSATPEEEEQYNYLSDALSRKEPVDERSKYVNKLMDVSKELERTRKEYGPDGEVRGEGPYYKGKRRERLEGEETKYARKIMLYDLAKNKSSMTGKRISPSEFENNLKSAIVEWHDIRNTQFRTGKIRGSEENVNRVLMQIANKYGFENWEEIEEYIEKLR